MIDPLNVYSNCPPMIDDFVCLPAYLVIDSIVFDDVGVRFDT